MQYLRITIIIAVCGGIASFLITHIYLGLKTGNVRHTDTIKFYSRETQPFRYWFVILLFTLITLLLFYVGWKALITALIGQQK
jgi:hypothetical protein